MKTLQRNLWSTNRWKPSPWNDLWTGLHFTIGCYLRHGSWRVRSRKNPQENLLSGISTRNTSASPKFGVCSPLTLPFFLWRTVCTYQHELQKSTQPRLWLTPGSVKVITASLFQQVTPCSLLPPCLCLFSLLHFAYMVLLDLTFALSACL